VSVTWGRETRWLAWVALGGFGGIVVFMCWGGCVGGEQHQGLLAAVGAAHPPPVREVWGEGAIAVC